MQKRVIAGSTERMLWTKCFFLWAQIIRAIRVFPHKSSSAEYQYQNHWQLSKAIGGKVQVPWLWSGKLQPLCVLHPKGRVNTKTFDCNFRSSVITGGITKPSSLSPSLIALPSSFSFTNVHLFWFCHLQLIWMYPGVVFKKSHLDYIGTIDFLGGWESAITSSQKARLLSLANKIQASIPKNS